MKFVHVLVCMHCGDGAVTSETPTFPLGPATCASCEMRGLVVLGTDGEEFHCQDAACEACVSPLVELAQVAE